MLFHVVRQAVDYTSLTAVLIWLAGAGGPYFIGQAMAFILENWPSWHNLPTAVKFLTPLIASVLVSVLATLALTQTELLAQASPTWTMIAQAVLMYLGSQQGYAQAKRAGYGASAKQAAYMQAAGKQQAFDLRE